MKILTDVPWHPRPNEVRLLFGAEQGDPDPVRSVFGFAFNADNQILMIRKQKGWDVPGGGKEIGETPAEAVVREIIEEAAVTVRNVRPVVTSRLEIFRSVRPEDHLGPFPVRHEVYFRCEVAELLEFRENGETAERGFFGIAAAFRQEGIMFGARALILKGILDEPVP